MGVGYVYKCMRAWAWGAVGVGYVDVCRHWRRRRHWNRRLILRHYHVTHHSTASSPPTQTHPVQDTTFTPPSHPSHPTPPTPTKQEALGSLVEIGRSKFYSTANVTTIFNGLFHAYKGFFQARALARTPRRAFFSLMLASCVCVGGGNHHRPSAPINHLSPPPPPPHNNQPHHRTTSSHPSSSSS